MQLKNKILSYFLLAIYLLVVLHHSVTHSHAFEFVGTPVSEASHQHGDFKDVHHAHQFHLGIFHFLGHLFENINHTDDHAAYFADTMPRVSEQTVPLSMELI